MNYLNKEELEKLKVGDKLECRAIEGFRENYLMYTLQIDSIKLGRNGYRIRTSIVNKDYRGFDMIVTNFTINGAFTNDGIHNPGKNYLKRKYSLCSQ